MYDNVVNYVLFFVLYLYRKSRLEYIECKTMSVMIYNTTKPEHVERRSPSLETEGVDTRRKKKRSVLEQRANVRLEACIFFSLDLFL